MLRVDDLSYGIDGRGDYALFIESWHFTDDQWGVDDDARTGKTEAIFFRVLYEGLPGKGHGWIEDNKVVQWG